MGKKWSIIRPTLVMAQVRSVLCSCPGLAEPDSHTRFSCETVWLRETIAANTGLFDRIIPRESNVKDV